MTPLVHALIRVGAAWPSAKAVADLVDAGLLWTGRQHAALARPPHRSLARRLQANREEIARLNVLAVGLVGQLIAHERLTGDPVFLLNRHTGFDTIVNVQSSFRLPRYSDEHDFDALVEVMLANDLLLEEPTTKLLRRVGYTNGWWLPARNPGHEFAPARAFRVTPHGRAVCALSPAPVFEAIFDFEQGDNLSTP